MATPSIAPVPLTGDLLIDAATHGYRWQLPANHTLNWALANGFSGEFWTSPSSTVSTLAQALSTFSSYADLHFNYVGYFTTPSVAFGAGSDITISLDGTFRYFSSTSEWAKAFFPNAAENARYFGAPGDVYLNIQSAANSLPSYSPGSAGFFLILHEVGHALGLKHPHDDGGTGHPTFVNIGLPELDKDWFSVMSYKDDYDFNRVSWDPATPMIMDVLALQYIYGKNMATNAGDTLHSLQINNIYQTLWDASGVDTVDVTTSTVGWTIQLPYLQLSTLIDTKTGWAGLTSEEALPSPLTWYWLAGDIENATGSAFADEITGNALPNVLSGGGGNDSLNGAEGDDTLLGGLGNDMLLGGVGNDLLNGGAGGNDILRGGAGNDTLVYAGGLDVFDGGAGTDTADFSSLASALWLRLGYTGDVNDAWSNGTPLADLIAIENVMGGNGADTIEGDAAANTLDGGAGNDLLNGGAGGNDILRGGAGNDTLVYAGGLDVFDGGAGTDTADFSGLTSALWLRLGYTGDVNDAWSNGSPLADLIAIENIMGGNGNDQLSGDGNSNVLNGGPGTDLLTGGLGNDVLFGGTGLDTAQFSGVRSTYTVSKAGSGVSVVGPDGTDKLSGVERLSFDDVLVRATPTPGDYFPDGRADLLWRHTDGTVFLWQLEASGGVAGRNLTSVGNVWHIVTGQGDYNADGTSDILWRHDDGHVYIWQLDGAGGVTAPYFLDVSNSWQIVDGVSDRNGDGTSDVLWRNSTDGRVFLWRMESGGGLLGAYLGGEVSNSWQIVDPKGDYNADGIADVLWRHTNGDVFTWTIDSAGAVTGRSYGNVTNDWLILDGTGDHNGDGTSDVLWRNASGDVRLWEMQANGAFSEKALPHLDTNWNIVSARGDYNADGKADILWRNADGRVNEWLMDSNNVVSNIFDVGNSWHIVNGSADRNADGTSDVLWRDSSATDGRLFLWQMNAAGGIADGGYLGGAVTSDWQIVT